MANSLVILKVLTRIWRKTRKSGTNTDEHYNKKRKMIMLNTDGVMLIS